MLALLPTCKKRLGTVKAP